ncbi:MAG: uroporphyrinogen-III C-methyltransferase [Verrucomicrobia bacterium]|nr:uroporphyrinogen-III C-methyltransferase [Cytophagales bacterium]
MKELLVDIFSISPVYQASNCPSLVLVGAGMGDPELITLKALKAIKTADVVLYDALINEELLDFCSIACEKIYVGKRGHQVSISQEAINLLIVEKALAKGKVVRLKGGDPFIFGRGQEEISFAQRFGIPTEYIPGISSILSGGNVNIPLTARGVSESFWAITGTKADGELSADLKLAAQSTATVVILMGMHKLGLIAEIYRQEGKGNLPAAIIQNASLENQQTAVGQAKELLALSEKYDLSAPAVIILGEVVKFYTQENKYDLLQSQKII